MIISLSFSGKIVTKYWLFNGEGNKRERERESVTSFEKRIDFMLLLGEGHLKVELLS